MSLFLLYNSSSYKNKGKKSADYFSLFLPTFHLLDEVIDLLNDVP
jgi:hypothetical protein